MSSRISMADKRRARKARSLKEPKGEDEQDASLAERATSAAPASRDDDSERALARMFAFGLPMTGLLAAAIVAWVGGLAPAILVLAGTALAGTIAFFWASLRTLSGEAPLPEGVLAHSTWSRVPAPERKREALRALKDLELEHSIGKIDDADYQEMSTRYRATAKAILRELDTELAPQRERAEVLVKSYLEKRNVKVATTGEAPPEEEEASEDAAPEKETSPRLTCEKCGVSNEPDAAFCKKCGGGLGASAAVPEKTDASA
jgi:hypothetical protein